MDGGILKLNPDKNAGGEIVKTDKSLGVKHLTKVASGADGRVFVGTKGGGVLIYDAESRHFAPYMFGKAT